MCILLTAGGTRVPLDPVRDITNNSQGTFGANLAVELLKRGAEVIYLCAEDSRTPFTVSLDLFGCPDLARVLPRLADGQEFARACAGRYQEVRFRTFADYQAAVRLLVQDQKPEAVVLAAAVSDYLVANPSPTKVRSGTELKVELVPAAKIIQQVKDWHPDTFLVGFKLLVGATDEELIEAAWNSIQVNRCDLVVANDLNSIARGRHEIILVEPTRQNGKAGAPPVATKYDTELAQQVAKRILRRRVWATSSSASPAAWRP